MSNLRKLAAALLCGAGIALTATSASAMPANPALKNAAPGAVENVRWGRGWGWGLGGFAAGAIIGSAIAAPYYYGGYYPYAYPYPAYPAYGYPPPPPPYYGAPAYGAAAPVGGGDASYCAQKYRSYDPATGTFLGYDGQRHPCP
jgi:BA14K-like protein